MYYCLECTNKMLMQEPICEDDVETRVFYCKNCGRTLPCVVRLKNYTALARLDTAAYKTFEKMCYWELMERWDEPQFQEEKEVFMGAIKRKQKEKKDLENLYNISLN